MLGTKRRVESYGSQCFTWGGSSVVWEGLPGDTPPPAVAPGTGREGAACRVQGIGALGNPHASTNYHPPSHGLDAGGGGSQVLAGVKKRYGWIHVGANSDFQKKVKKQNSSWIGILQPTH